LKYSTVSQIYVDMEGTFHALKGAVLPLSDPQTAHRIAEDRWTIAEIIEHLALVESRLYRLLNISSNKLEKAAPLLSPPIPLTIEIPDGVERNDFFKVKTQKEYEPTGTASSADSIIKLQNIHDDLNVLRPLLERIDLNAVRFDHWLLGSLSLGQWLAFIAIHEQRHLGQIQHILASDSFPKR
jgi:hypothetical protein